jgi:emericellamide synthase (highly reducing iterative type I polyketide synthase)
VNGTNGMSQNNRVSGTKNNNDINGVNGIKETNSINGVDRTNGVNDSEHTSIIKGSNHVNEKTELESDVATELPRVFILSGAEEQGCYRNARRLAEYSSKTLAASLEDVNMFLDRLALTVNKRTIHDYSASVVAYDEDDLLAQLDVLEQMPVPVRAPFKGGARVGYVFGGQGAQYHNMGRELINDWPVFHQSLDRASTHLRALGCQWDLFTELSHESPKTSRVDEPEYGQTLSTAIQLALVDTLASLKLRPSIVVGHSSGEIAAAYAVDALTFEDALTVAYHRGRLTSKLISTGVSGGMLAVGATPEVVQTFIEQIKTTDTALVKIACYNSPTSVTLSGGNDGIEQIARLLQKADVFHRKLKTQGAAYHSQMMQSIEDEYRSAIAHIQPRPITGRMMSSLWGKELPTGSLLDGDYWARNLISPVLFGGALKGLILGEKHGGPQHTPEIDILLEVGPHAQMQGAVKETLKGLGSSTRIQYVSCLKRKASATETMLRALADLFALGAPIDFHRANAGFRAQLPRRLRDVPPYAFNHEQRHWHETRVTREFSHRQFLPHELLGNLSSDVNHTEPKWRRFLRLKELPWLQQHIVQGQVIFPAAGYLAMALEAMRRFMAFKDESKAVIGYTLSDCSFSKALVLKEGDTETEICLSLRPEAQSAKSSWPDWKEFRVFSTNSGKEWNEHCRGRIRVITDDSMLADRLCDNLKVKEQTLASISHHISPNRFYATARQVGMEWYAPFDNVVDLQGRTDCCVTTNKMPNVQGSAHPFGPQTYIVHPGMLDSTLFHGICASLLVEREIRAPVVPVFIEQVTISTAFEVPEGTELRTYALAKDAASSWSAQIEVEERSVISVHGMRTAQLPGNVEAAMSRQLAHSPEWVLHHPSMTRQQIIAQCKDSLPVGSSRLRNIAVSTDVRTHVQRALDQIEEDQVASDYRQLWYKWMQGFLATDAYSPEVVLEAREATTSDTSVAFEAVKRVGENLVDLLRGTADPLSFLTPDDLLGRMYSEERNARCYHQINMYCKALGLHNPSLRMLEVGGGTASATLPLLQTMSQNGQPLIGQYDFTDLSTAFFPAARKRLAQCGHNVNYEAFDLAQAPDTQGLEPGSYDVVIACNVVHATPDIASSLNNIRQLLRPGGTLILMEITTPEPSYQLVFGSLPGWWSGAGEGRVKSPILPDAEWKQKLQEQGFESDPIIVSDYAESEGGTMSVIFAKTSVESKPDLSEISLHLASGLARDSIGNLENIAETLRQSPGLGLRQITTGGLESITNIADTVLVVDSEICEALARMDASLWQQLQNCALSCKALLLITRGAAMNTTAPDGALTLGFARSLRLEQPSIRYITLDLDPSTLRGADDERTSSLITQLLTSQTFDFNRSLADVDYEFAERNGQLYVNRLFHNEKLEQTIVRCTSRSKPEQTSFLNRSRPLRVEPGVPGLLETFRWVDDHEYSRSLEPHEIRIECRAASINFRDVLIATGELGGSATMMNDCAGTVVEVGSQMSSRYAVGDRVCSYYAQSYNNYPIVDGDHAARIPDNVSFSLGASLPIVWATTYHSLVNVARLKAGESILIHAAAGAVGQAAVILAQHLGAVVYATCGSKEKRALLESIGVPQTHIFTSRSPAFGPALRASIGNKGVNVILNSLAGELFRESLDCLASFGRFVEIGKKDFLDNSLMPTKFLLQNITFACVDLVQMMAEDKQLVYRLLNDVVELIASGELKNQVTIQPYKLGEIEAAFRLISSGKHMGKVILTVDQDELVPVRTILHDPFELAIGRYTY